MLDVYCDYQSRMVGDLLQSLTKSRNNADLYRREKVFENIRAMATEMETATILQFYITEAGHH